jgi:hypothetical protein
VLWWGRGEGRGLSKRGARAARRWQRGRRQAGPAASRRVKEGAWRPPHLHDVAGLEVPLVHLLVLGGGKKGRGRGRVRGQGARQGKLGLHGLGWQRPSPPCRRACRAGERPAACGLRPAPARASPAHLAARHEHVLLVGLGVEHAAVVLLAVVQRAHHLVCRTMAGGGGGGGRGEERGWAGDGAGGGSAPRHQGRARRAGLRRRPSSALPLKKTPAPSPGPSLCPTAA